MQIGGIDEAGRGPVIGPMVIAITVMEEETQGILKRLGVRDSKEIGAEKREKLFTEIVEMCTVKYTIIPPEEIDEYVKRNGLNELEAKKIADIISTVHADVYYIDSPDPDPSVFAKRILSYVQPAGKVIADNGADRKYIPVSAASIVAKTIREKEIAKMKEKYGDFGSGYPGDWKTIDFLKKWTKKYGKLPSFSRKSWITSKRILEEATQRNLFDFV